MICDEMVGNMYGILLLPEEERDEKERRLGYRYRHWGWGNSVNVGE